MRYAQALLRLHAAPLLCRQRRVQLLGHGLDLDDLEIFGTRACLGTAALSMLLPEAAALLFTVASTLVSFPFVCFFALTIRRKSSLFINS